MRNIAYACMRLVIAASFAISMGLSAATPAAAFTGDQLQHVVDCIGWMFSDPARHAAECGPGHIGNITSDSRGWGYQATPAPKAPPKTCDDSGPSIEPGAFRSGSADPSLLLVAGSTDCGCATLQAYRPSAPDFAQIIPVDDCCDVAFHRDITGASPDLLLKVQSIECDAFRFEELTLPELTI